MMVKNCRLTLSMIGLKVLCCTAKQSPLTSQEAKRGSCICSLVQDNKRLKIVSPQT